jgi:hypothetical protein
MSGISECIRHHGERQPFYVMEMFDLGWRHAQGTPVEGKVLDHGPERLPCGR